MMETIFNNLLTPLGIAAILFVFKEVYSLKNEVTQLKTQHESFIKIQDENNVEFKDLKKEIQSLRESIIGLNITLKSIQSRSID